MGLGVKERSRSEVFDDLFQTANDLKQDYENMVLAIDLVRMKMQCMKLYLDCDFIQESDRGFYVRDIEAIDAKLEDLSNSLTGDYEAYTIN